MATFVLFEIGYFNVSKAPEEAQSFLRHFISLYEDALDFTTVAYGYSELCSFIWYKVLIVHTRR